MSPVTCQPFSSMLNPECDQLLALTAVPFTLPDSCPAAQRMNGDR